MYYFRVAVLAAILALVGAGEAAAIAPRGGGDCSCDIKNSIAVCANCDQICVLNGLCI